MFQTKWIKLQVLCSVVFLLPTDRQWCVMMKWWRGVWCGTCFSGGIIFEVALWTGCLLTVQASVYSSAFSLQQRIIICKTSPFVCSDSHVTRLKCCCGHVTSAAVFNSRHLQLLSLASEIISVKVKHMGGKSMQQVFQSRLNWHGLICVYLGLWYQLNWYF